ncbi:MAG TPA: NAD(P)H-dependent oxidoreductase [Candidatus Saccharimonadales bacterium]
MALIKIIIGSTRPGRFGNQPAEWIKTLGDERAEHSFEIIDLAEVNLPLLDEPQPALSGNYANDHTKSWSKTISEADGFIFVTPEYNHAAPAALKNAIDYLAAEWRHKPAAFVSYGVEGGVRAVENLRVVAGNLSMYSLYETVTLVNYWAQLDQDGMFVPSPDQITKAHKLLDAVTFWADHFKDARTKLQK